MKFDFGEKSFFVYVYVHPLPAFMAPDIDSSFQEYRNSA